MGGRERDEDNERHFFEKEIGAKKKHKKKKKHRRGRKRERGRRRGKKDWKTQ